MTYRGDIPALLRLQTVIAVYLVVSFPISRPRALLGEEHLRRVLDQIAMVRCLFPSGAYATVCLIAAGAATPAVVRLVEGIAVRTGLRAVVRDCDLQIRLRRSLSDAWEADVVQSRYDGDPLSGRRTSATACGGPFGRRDCSTVPSRPSGKSQPSPTVASPNVSAARVRCRAGRSWARDRPKSG